MGQGDFSWVWVCGTVRGEAARGEAEGAGSRAGDKDRGDDVLKPSIWYCLWVALASAITLSLNPISPILIPPSSSCTPSEYLVSCWRNLSFSCWYCIC